MIASMPTRSKPKSKPGHADPEEYQRFLALAREVGASDDPADLERAVRKVVGREGIKTDPS